MNILATDWLLKNEDSFASEEELDRPYAFYKRIYTRREFEEIRERAEQTRKEAFVEHNRLLEQDREIFFDNIDYIIAHKELIYTDKKLADSMPILFGHGARWIGGRRITLSAILHFWEKGAWKWDCPVCGAESYLFWSFDSEGALFCPKCKKITSSWLVKEQKIFPRPCKSPEQLLAETPYRRYISSKECENEQTENITVARNEVDSSQLHSFKEISLKWKKEAEEPKEIRVARSRFEVARRHGGKIFQWLCEIENNEAILAETRELMEKKRISDVEELLERIQKLADSQSRSKG